MKQIFRILSMIALVFLGAGQTWAKAPESNSRVTFVYEEEHGTAFASAADGSGKVTITVTPVGDYRCLDGDLTAETIISSIYAGARTRTTSSINYGEPITVTCTKTNEFTLQLPADDKEEVRVTVRFREKDTFTPTVSIEGWTYGDDAKTPTDGNNTSGGGVTYTYADTQDGNYDTPVPTQAGSHWVKATVAATADYKTCESDPVEFEISQKSITINEATVGVEDKMYDGTTTATLFGTPSFDDGMIVEDDDVSIDASGASATFADKNVGENKVVTVTGLVLAGDDIDNYVLLNSPFTTTASITKQELTVSAMDHSINYGDEPANNGVEYYGFVEGEDESVLSGELDYDYTYTQGDLVGDNYFITPKGLISNNYNIYFAKGKLTVEKRMLTFSGSDISGIEKEYDGKTDVANLDKIDIRPQGIYNNDDVEVVAVSGCYASKDVGNNIEVTIYEVELSGNKKANYDIDYNPAVKTTGIINQRHVKITGISVTPKVYDGGTWADVNCSSAVFDKLVDGDDIEPDILLASYYDANVGTNKHVSLDYEEYCTGLTGDDKDNYILDRDQCVGETTGNINKAPLTVTAKDAQVKFGEDAPAFSVEYGDDEGNDFVDGEDESYLGGTLAFDCSYTQGDAVGEYDITPKGLIAANYEITFVSGTLKVVPAELQLFAANTSNLWMTWCDKDEYVKPNGVTVYSVSGVGTDKVTLSEDESTAQVGEETVSIIPAYTPVLIYRASAGTGAVTAAYRAAGTAPSGYDSSTGIVTTGGTGYSFCGATQSVASIPGFTVGSTYALYGGKFLLVDTDAGIAAHKCWLTLSTPNAARQLSIEFDDETTGVESEKVIVNSEEFAAATVWYDLQGRKLDGKPTKKGLYIYKGKKTVISKE